VFCAKEEEREKDHQRQGPRKLAHLIKHSRHIDCLPNVGFLAQEVFVEINRRLPKPLDELSVS